MAKKKFAELKLSFLHLQQNGIPEMSSVVHLVIQLAVELVGPPFL